MNKYNRMTKQGGMCESSVYSLDFQKYVCGDYIVAKQNDGLVQQLIERLAEFEDKLEAGLLLELPCKVGDKVYKIDTILYEYCEHEVGGFSVENGELIILDCIDNRYKASELYFSKAEAEARLEQIKQEN